MTTAFAPFTLQALRLLREALRDRASKLESGSSEYNLCGDLEDDLDREIARRGG